MRERWKGEVCLTHTHTHTHTCAATVMDGFPKFTLDVVFDAIDLQMTDEQYRDIVALQHAFLHAQHEAAQRRRLYHALLW